MCWEGLSIRLDVPGKTQALGKGPQCSKLPHTHHLADVVQEVFNTLHNLCVAANQLDTTLIRTRHRITEYLDVGLSPLQMCTDV